MSSATVPATLLAHAFGQRYTLPLPLLLFVLGGAVAVGASFLVVLPRTVAARDEYFDGDDVPLEPARPVWNGLAVIVLVALIACGVGGSQEVPENIVPTVFWLVTWIAVPLSCGLIGDWTRPVNPFRALARLADSDRARETLFGDPEPMAWPAWLAWWPAVVTFAFLVGGELVFNLTATLPRMIAYGLLTAALVSALMGLVFGAERWLNRGEMFSVLFSTWGRLGCFRFGARGERGFARGLEVPFEASLSRVLFVLMLLVSVAFDGLLSTPGWRRFHLRLNQATGGRSIDDDTVTMLVFFLLTLVLLVAFGAFAVAVTRVGGHGLGAVASLAALLPSLAPISFGYLLAHNLDNLAINSQLLIPLAGNPTGRDGWQWLPAPFDDSYEIRLKLIPPALYWYVAVAVIIAVHVLAVVLAHRHLARAGATAQQARRSEYPWIVAMIGYTMLSLWLLAQPLVREAPSHSESLPTSVSTTVTRT
jgi:hypothetical protein